MQGCQYSPATCWLTRTGRVASLSATASCWPSPWSWWARRRRRSSTASEAWRRRAIRRWRASRIRCTDARIWCSRRVPRRQRSSRTRSSIAHSSSSSSSCSSRSWLYRHVLRSWLQHKWQVLGQVLVNCEMVWCQVDLKNTYSISSIIVRLAICLSVQRQLRFKMGLATPTSNRLAVSSSNRWNLPSCCQDVKNR